MKVWIKIIVILGVIFIAVFLLIQLVPYGHVYTNPPLVREPKWDSPQTRELAKRACFDCHSNETIYPWYSYVAPVSWLLRSDIDKGRNIFNFSDWQPYPELAGEMTDYINRGAMPPSRYTLIHSTARLTPAEKQQLIKGLQAAVNNP
jgi:hypothetical protein